MPYAKLDIYTNVDCSSYDKFYNSFILWDKSGTVLFYSLGGFFLAYFLMDQIPYYKSNWKYLFVFKSWMKYWRVSVIVLIANTGENRDNSQGQGPIVAITVQNIQWKIPLLWGVYRLRR